MSKTILNDHLWTEEEVEYQLARDLRDEVAANRRLYGKGGQREGQDDSANDEQLQLDRDVYEHVVNLESSEVEKELESLNLSTKGDDSDQRGRLAQALQAKKTEDATSNQ